MTDFLVVSHNHSLLPMAWRITKEIETLGEDHGLDIVVASLKYTKAWQGKLPKRTLKLGVRGGRKKDEYEREMTVLADEVSEAGKVVITDNGPFADRMMGHEGLYSGIDETGMAIEKIGNTVAQFGAWFDGSKFHTPHLLVWDIGVWHGGMGPREPGGLTLVRIDSGGERVLSIYALVASELKARAFRGLVRITVRFDQEGEGLPTLVGYDGGWKSLHMHAYLDGMDNPGLIGMLQGEAPSVSEKKYRVALPVSIPPWPSRSAEKVAQVALSGDVATQFYYHDMMVEAGELKSAELDGLLGVSRFGADNLALARSSALGVARSVAPGVGDLQYRMDVGAQVDDVLGAMEMMGLGV